MGILLQTKGMNKLRYYSVMKPWTLPMSQVYGFNAQSAFL